MNVEKVNSNPNFGIALKANKTVVLIGRTFIKKPINANRVIAMPFSKTIWNNEGNNAQDILKIIAKKIHIGKNSLISQNIKLIGEKITIGKNAILGNTESEFSTIIGDKTRTLNNYTHGSLVLGDGTSSKSNMAWKNLFLGEKSTSKRNNAQNIFIKNGAKTKLNKAENEISLGVKASADECVADHIIMDSGVQVNKIFEYNVDTDFVNMYPNV